MSDPVDARTGSAAGKEPTGSSPTHGSPGAAERPGGPNGPSRSFGTGAADFPDITTDGDLTADVEGSTDGGDVDPVEEDLVEMVEVGVRLQAERDEYLDLARRVQAEFENYKRRVEAQRVEQRARAAEDLARELLPVLDAGEAATSHGHEHAAALHTQLVVTLEKLGLEKVDAVDVVFDPNIHEAVLHEEGDSESPEVAEVMRTGYLWNSRVLRPAMVKVRG